MRQKRIPIRCHQCHQVAYKINGSHWVRHSVFGFGSRQQLIKSIQVTMAAKIVIALAMFAVAHCAVLRTAAPVAVAPAPVPVLAKTVELEEVDPHPQYTYSYDVQDTLSGDNKGHVEERDGDVVRGEYSLIDADGFKRTVTYTADSINGFNAVVRREPLAAVVAAEPVVKVAAPLQAAPVAPVALAAPAPIVRSAPVVVAAPLIKSARLAATAPFVSSAPLAVAAPAPVLRSASYATPLRYTAPAYTVAHL
ncbi:larval cuticle protein A1A isoform X1 [Drosophila teissieri]|uniref:larval cuticle protein A1A isoform X1 n=2 Tax=Drosophila teissieri TaxID=7243 RepID=UPI001CB9FC25|nr:larval cuticle protein A1A isoform X1 [Drosophila teissieri]